MFFDPIVWAACLAGSIVGSLNTGNGCGIGKRLTVVIVGTLTAGCISPVITELIKFQSQAGLIAVCFLLGLIAMPLTGMIVDGATRARDNPVLLVVWFRMIWKIWKGQSIDDGSKSEKGDKNSPGTSPGNQEVK